MLYIKQKSKGEMKIRDKFRNPGTEKSRQKSRENHGKISVKIT
jgi:hypothetical protein